ncbi:hypothetical protein BS78_01G203500 [Paspalum vaginatum]|nr:hypothetical protein BS78_01G203500 [Paspalum vaginatum]
MGRAPCCEKEGLRRGAWSPEEDERLVAYIRQHGHPNWRALPRQAGLLRCGKSCRLRWINYLRPDIKRGDFSADEEALIVRLHRELGNRWSAIAAQLPGRTDNEIKNVWHTHIKKRLEEDREAAGGRRQQEDNKKARKSKPAAAKRSATAAKPPKAAGADDDSAQRPFLTASSPGLSSSVSSGVTFSATATESTAAAAVSVSVSSGDNDSSHRQLGAKAEMDMESFSSAEFPPIDEAFWSSPDVVDMGLGAMDEELAGLAGAPSSSTRDEDMAFWLNMLLEAGDMRDLSVL